MKPADRSKSPILSARAIARHSIAPRLAFSNRRFGAAAINATTSPSGVAVPSLPSTIPGRGLYWTSPPDYLTDPAAAVAQSIAVGDVSGDGRDDLVFLSWRPATILQDGRNEIYVAVQGENGRLNPAVKVGESNHLHAVQLLVADLDDDGVDDIITTITNGVMALHSNADGTFRTSTASVVDPYDLVATDVDRDGSLDILVDSSNTSATVVHGDGLGGFLRTSTLPLPSSAVRTTGDMNGDGLDDLILATIYSRPLQEFHVYPALVSGGYGPPDVLYRPLSANHAGSLAAGDFNGDGRHDLIIDEAKDYGSIDIYLQDANGKLGPRPSIARSRGAGSLVATDLNRDGRMDFALAHSGWGDVSYYLQTTTGFSPEKIIAAYQYMGRLNYFAAGDLNHDGCGDLVVSRWTQSPVVIYGQGCSAEAMADCNLPAMPVGKRELP